MVRHRLPFPTRFRRARTVSCEDGISAAAAELSNQNVPVLHFQALERMMYKSSACLDAVAANVKVTIQLRLAGQFDRNSLGAPVLEVP